MESRGNFMLQALFALAFVIAFLPIFVKKEAEKNAFRENGAVVTQLAAAFDAARAFVGEEYDNLPIGIKWFSNEEFVERLEAFGLPLGFIPVTALGQKISLVTGKSDDSMIALLVIDGGKTDKFRRAEITARIGFWGAVFDNGTLKGATGGWEIAKLPKRLRIDPNAIIIRIPEDDEFSEKVVRNAKSPIKNIFHTNLDMDGNNIEKTQTLSATNAAIKVVSASNFLLSGIEGDRKSRNEIASLRANRVWIRSSDGNPLTIVRSDLRVGTFIGQSIAGFGELPALSARKVNVRDFNMAAGRTSFNGPGVWNIDTSANFTNITLNVERISIDAFLDASRGQDFFIDEYESGALEYLAGSGIRANVITTDNIVMRDQVSSELINGGTGPVILEIRPAGTSVLPDVFLSGLSNDSIKIPLSPEDNEGKTETCRSIIIRYGGRYNAMSLSDNIVCQFVMFNRIERRIEIMKCLKMGGGKCF